MATLDGQNISLSSPDEGDATVAGQNILMQSTTPIDANDLYRSYDNPNYVFSLGSIPSTGVNPVLISSVIK